MQKYSHFEAYSKERTQKYTIFPLKNLKNEIFIANNLPKQKLLAAESLE